MRTLHKYFPIVVIVSLLIGGMMGCELDGETNENGTKIVSLTPYSAVTYADLGDTGEISNYGVPTIADILTSSGGGLGIISHAAEIIGDDGVAVVPKSIDATIALEIEDEQLDITETVNADEITWLGLDIEYMDMLLTGGIHSLAHLVDAIFDDSDAITGIFPAEAEIGFSFKAAVSGGLDACEENVIDHPMKTSQSGYLDVSLSGLTMNAAGSPSAGTLDASLKFSAALDYWVEIVNYGVVYHDNPVCISIAMKPIENANLVAFSNFNPTTSDEAWEGIRDALWGSAATDCLVITASYKNAEGNIVTLDSVKDKEAIMLTGIFGDSD